MRTASQGFGQLLSAATPMLDTPWVRASLDKVPDDVASMFDGVADRYDVANEVLALGQTRVWRKALVTAGERELGSALVPDEQHAGGEVARDHGRAAAGQRLARRPGPRRQVEDDLTAHR